jgi:hypothetical protein
VDCAAHDIAPIVEKVFGVRSGGLKKNKGFVKLVEKMGSGRRMGVRSGRGLGRDRGASLYAPHRDVSTSPPQRHNFIRNGILRRLHPMPAAAAPGKLSRQPSATMFLERAADRYPRSLPVAQLYSRRHPAYLIAIDKNQIWGSSRLLDRVRYSKSRHAPSEANKVRCDQ